MAHLGQGSCARMREGYYIKWRKDHYDQWADIWSNTAPVFALALSALIFLTRKHGPGFYVIEALYSDDRRQRCAYIEFKSE